MSLKVLMPSWACRCPWMGFTLRPGPEGLSDHQDGGEVHGRACHEHHECGAGGEAFEHEGGRHGNAAGGADVHGHGHDEDDEHLQQRLRAKVQEEFVGNGHLDECSQDKANGKAPANVLYHLEESVAKNAEKLAAAFHRAGAAFHTLGR